MKKKLAFIVAVVALASSLGSNASALTITDANIVGLIVDAVPYGDAERFLYLNTMLSRVTPSDSVVAGERYIKLNDFGDSGVSDANTLSGTGVATISGYDYVLVKYDGPNAGAIVFYLGGASFALPQFDKDSVTLKGIFGGQTGVYDGCELKGNCGISGWTAYNVPDGGTTLSLLGGALLGLGLLRRKFNV